MQTEITRSGPLLDEHGRLTQVGWSRHPYLDCNLENAEFYAFRSLQFLRIKRWDYYAIFTPARFYSFTIADLGYAGNIFAYTLDYASGKLHEETLVPPFSRGVSLPRNSTSGDSHFDNGKARVDFAVTPSSRQISVDWPGFDNGKGMRAEISLACPVNHESMNITIPIHQKRFYYNRKINCLPAQGAIQYGDHREELDPSRALGSLDWGRGVWEYRGFWNWASASGYLPDGRTVGLNLGCGFGDISAASEDCLILDGCVHKLEPVKFDYEPNDYNRPWVFTDKQGRLQLEFKPFKERVARTNLGIIFSEVHQMFGCYSGRVTTDSGEQIEITDLIGFAEEHRARW